MEQRRIVNAYYKNELSSIEEISFLEEEKDCYSNYWLTTILLDAKSTIAPEDLRLHLDKDNIESRRLWKPMHLQPIFKDSISYTNGVAEDLFNRGLCLPSGSNMSNNDLQRVISKIKKFMKLRLQNLQRIYKQLIMIFLDVATLLIALYLAFVLRIGIFSQRIIFMSLGGYFWYFLL